MQKKIEERTCGNGKCGRIYVDNSKSKYCPMCRRRFDLKLAKGVKILKTAGVIAITTVPVVPIIRKVIKK